MLNTPKDYENIWLERISIAMLAIYAICVIAMIYGYFYNQLGFIFSGTIVIVLMTGWDRAMEYLMWRWVPEDKDLKDIDFDGES